MKKARISMILCLAVCLALFTGCAGSGLSDQFDEDEVKDRAKETITIVNDEDSEALVEMCTLEMKEALTEEILAEVYKAINEGGGFEGFQDIRIAGNKEESPEDELAIAVVKATYKNKEFTYTLTFNRNLELAGLYYK